MRILLALAVLGACSSPGHTPAADAPPVRVDAPEADSAPPMPYDVRPTTRVVVGAEWVAWAQVHGPCTIGLARKGGGDCHDPGPSVSRRALAGGAAETLLVTAIGASTLVGDDSALFAIDSDSERVVRIAGEPPTATAVSPLTSTARLGPAVDADHVYWSNGGSISRANLDGSNAEVLAPDTNVADDLLLFGDQLWWPWDSTLYRMPAAGGTPVPVGFPLAIATVSGGRLWASKYSSVVDAPSQIVSIAPDGTVTVVIDQLDQAHQAFYIAADDTELFWRGIDGTIYRAPVAGGPITAMVDPQPGSGLSLAFAITPTSILLDFDRNGFRTLPR